MLLSAPPILGNLLEPLLGLLGDARDRRLLVRAGGACFVAALVLLAAGHGFPAALVAFLLLNPASGAFVGLSQAALMDLEPGRHVENMARWSLAGSMGVVAGPLVLTGMGVADLGWRAAFGALALLGGLVLALGWRAPLGGGASGAGRAAGASLRRVAAGALDALKDRAVLRWATLLQFADLTLDVLHGFLALYFVDVAGGREAGAAFAILVWTGAGLIGDALLIPLLRRTDGTRWVRRSAMATLLLFPAFLLANDIGGKLAVLGALGLLSSGWYAILKGRLYGALPGRSATVMAVSSAFGMAGAVLPLGVAVAAERWGLGAAMWLLMAGPVALLVGVPRTLRVDRPPPGISGGVGR